VLIAVPAVRLSVVALEILGVPAAALIAIEIAALLTSPFEVIETVPTAVPEAVGEPVIRPEDALMAKPAGKPVAVYCSGGVAVEVTW